MSALNSPLRTLAYSSSATRDLDVAFLRELFFSAAQFNDKVGVTGLLLFANGVFIQTIEGGADDVETVLVRIQDDKSHRIENIFVDEPVALRMYPDWAMMASLFPADGTLISLLEARKEAPGPAFTHGQLVGIRRTVDFVNQQGAV